MTTREPSPQDWRDHPGKRLEDTASASLAQKLASIEAALDRGVYKPGPWAAFLRDANACPAERAAIAADVSQSFAFDNGAYTYWQNDRPYDFAGYLEWCRQWCRHPAFDWCVIPDLIDGTEAQNDQLVNDWPLPPYLSVPVWHLHESLQRLCLMATRFPRIALGSSGQWPNPGTDSWWMRIGEAMTALTVDGRPLCKLHGLRMLDPSIFTKLPLASADSTNAVRNGNLVGRFGMYPAPSVGARQAIIGDRIEAHQSAAVWDCRVLQPELFELVS